MRKKFMIDYELTSEVNFGLHIGKVLACFLLLRICDLKLKNGLFY